MGNPTSYLGSTLTWEGKQLTGVGTTTYAYDENGLRTQKTVSGTTTNYHYNGSVLMSLVQGGNTLLFSYDAQGRAAAVSFNGTYYYYIRNGQGDVIKLIDNSKNTVVEYTYDTWGKQLSCTGSLASTLGVLNPFRYRGYVYDEETQWYYLQSRYYNPEVGRFISADVLLSTGQGVLGHNTFAYCLGNPGNMADEGGTIPFLLITAACGAIVGAVVGGVVAATSGGSTGDVLAGIAIGAAAGGLIGLGAGAAAGVVLAGSATASTAAVASGASALATSVATGGMTAGGAFVEENIRNAFSSTSTTASGITAAAEKGRLGEQASGIVKNTERIYDNLVSSAKYRIPDGLDHYSKILSEVKNYSGKLSYTAQLRDFVSWSQAHGYRMDLYTNASVTKPLQNLIDQGIINKIPLN